MRLKRIRIKPNQKYQRTVMILFWKKERKSLYLDPEVSLLRKLINVYANNINILIKFPINIHIPSLKMIILNLGQSPGHYQNAQTYQKRNPNNVIWAKVR